MKNIFKFMGLALVAGSLLFTACKKDEPENNDTTPNQPVSTVVKTVNFDGSEWTPASIYATEYASYGLINWSVEGGANASDPMTFGYSGNTAGRTFEFDGNSTGIASYYYWMYLRNDDDYYTAMGSDSTMHDYPMWQPYTCVNNFQAFDANANTVSMTVNAQVFDVETYETTNEAIVKNLTVTLKDATWEVGE